MLTMAEFAGQHYSHPWLSVIPYAICIAGLDAQAQAWIEVVTQPSTNTPFHVSSVIYHTFTSIPFSLSVLMALDMAVIVSPRSGPVLGQGGGSQVRRLARHPAHVAMSDQLVPVANLVSLVCYAEFIPMLADLNLHHLPGSKCANRTQIIYPP